MRRLCTTIVLAALAMSGCGTAYDYVPVNATASVRGRPAAGYTIPDGTVRLATFGLKRVRSRTDPDARVAALHVRMDVSNDGDTAWNVDTRSVIVALPGAGDLRPSFVNARHGSALPNVPIPPGQAESIDLYYRMPDAYAEAAAVPSFDVLWAVRTDEGLVAERTPFDRVLATPSSNEAHGELGPWGPGPFWANPETNVTGSPLRDR